MESAAVINRHFGGNETLKSLQDWLKEELEKATLTEKQRPKVE